MSVHRFVRCAILPNRGFTSSIGFAALSVTTDTLRMKCVHRLAPCVVGSQTQRGTVAKPAAKCSPLSMKIGDREQTFADASHRDTRTRSSSALVKHEPLIGGFAS